MKCKQCEVKGLKSIVYVGSSSQTLMMYQQYYDEDGKEHFHNPNWTTTNYGCSNGHSWSEKTRSACWCGFGKQEPSDAPST